MTFEEDSKFEWREKYEEDRDVEEYKTTTMKELGLTKARSSVINLKKGAQGVALSVWHKLLRSF